MYRSILVPLDGTPFGDHALPCAVRIAEATGAALELLHVHRYVERDPGLSTMPQYQFQHIARTNVEYDRARADEEVALLERRAADIRHRFHLQVHTRVVDGHTAAAVAEEAARIGADLVVLSSHGRTGLDRVWHGSMAAALISRVDVPVLCVRPLDDAEPPPPSQLRNALVALDGSPFSEQVLEAAAPLFQALDTRVTLLHVLSPPLLRTSNGGDFSTIATRAQALLYLEELAERYEDRVPDARIMVLENGEPAALIASLLAGGEYDLGVLATHGRSGLSRMLMGSVAESVLASTWRPLLLFRPTADAGLTTATQSAAPPIAG